MTVPSAVMKREGVGWYSNPMKESAAWAQFLKGVEKGVQDRDHGRVTSLEQVVEELGLK
jgi:hypothetical protein